MKYGLHLPNFGAFGDARVLAALSRDAEDAGWDGFFLWDHLLFCEFDRNNHVDPWVALTAVASSTERILLGPLVTPLARRLPWELARQSVSLQNFSGGRLVLGVGLGEPTEWDFRYFGQETDAVVRGQKLDEGLAILSGLWSGDTFGFDGKHYSLERMTFLPTPVSPIPIWVGGSWPHRRPFRRAAKYDGVMPMMNAELTVESLRPIVEYVASHRQSPGTGFDVIVSGVSTPDGSGVPPGIGDIATWWLEDISPLRFGWDWPELANDWDVEALRSRILAGPPAGTSWTETTTGP
jgi:alkanesulfonate monooxygenase SsuD/methylene tetrahydromethanopterin reductase-like flavin-dependent oxidoreductase (luciferase family)